MDLLGFLRERFVPLFERGVALLEERSTGSDGARAALEDVRGYRGATRIDLDGSPRAFVAFDAGKVTVTDAAPEGARVRTALDLPSTLAEKWIGDILLASRDTARSEGAAPPRPSECDSPGPHSPSLGFAEPAPLRGAEDEAALSAARLVSKRSDEIVGDDPLELHLVLTGTADGDATVRIGLGASEPPVEPRFTATIAWSDLHGMKERGENLQQLFFAGKLRLAGDYSRALVLAMKLAESRTAEP